MLTPLDKWFKLLGMRKTSIQYDFRSVALGTGVALAIIFGGGCAALAEKPAATTADPLKVHFQEAKNKEALLKAYPFTGEMLKDVELHPTADSGLSPTRVYFSNVSRQKADTKLFLLKLEGGDVCGSAGCMMTVYQDAGQGFKTIHDLYTLGPVYVATKEAGKHILILCSGDKGRVEITQQNQGGKFTDPKSYTGKSTLDSCLSGTP